MMTDNLRGLTQKYENLEETLGIQIAIHYNFFHWLFTISGGHNKIYLNKSMVSMYDDARKMGCSRIINIWIFAWV